MFKQLFFISVIITIYAFSALPSFAQSAVNTSPEQSFADDDNYQEYKGKIGRWISVSGKKKLGDYIAYYESTAEEVSAVNKGLAIKGGYTFIPYGKSFIEKLEKSGIKRQTIASAADQFIWPVTGYIQISSVLGFRGRDFHTGMDIPAPKGTVIRASMEGQIVYTGFQGGYGNMVDIQHRNSFITRYAHNTVILVKNGEFVKKGQTIALAGSTGRSTGSHCHFEIRCNTIPLDPMDFLPDAEKIPATHTMKSWKNAR